MISCRSCTGSVTLRVPPPRATATSTWLADAVVEQRVHRVEVRHRLAVDRDQHVADRELAVGGRARLDLGDDQHAGARWRGLARLLLGRRREPEAPQLIVGRVAEHGLQRAARHRLAGLDLLERAHHALSGR